ncbi:MAG TPA: lysylphosphatidylglycerol synthase transmembrane domain-containing protein [Pseudolabrys sp.]
MRNVLLFALKAAVSFALLYFVFSHVNFVPVEQQLGHLSYTWLVAAVLILIAQTFLGSLRWRIIVLRCNPPDAPTFTIASALRYNFIAAFFNQTLPSSVGGDAVRIWLLGRDNGGWSNATYSVLIDRVVGVLALALLVIVCLPWSFVLISDTSGRVALLIIGFGSLGACLSFLAVGFLPWPWLDRWWLTRKLAAAAALGRAVVGSASSGAAVAAYSLIIHFLSVTAAWCLAKSVAAPLEWSQALFLVLPVILITTIPLSIAGWGTRETAMVLAFGYAGLPEGDGLIISILFGLATFAAGLIGGGVWLLDRSRRRFQAPR